MQTDEKGKSEIVVRSPLRGLIARGGFFVAALGLVLSVSCNKDNVVEEFFLVVSPEQTTGQPGNTVNLSIETRYTGADVNTIRIEVYPGDGTGYWDSWGGEMEMIATPFFDSVTPMGSTYALVVPETGPPLVYEFEHTTTDHTDGEDWGWSTQDLELELMTTGAAAMEFHAFFDGEHEIVRSVDIESTYDIVCTEDPLEDFVDSILSETTTFMEAWFDITCFSGVLLPLTQEQADTDYNLSTYECGTSAGGMRTVCSSGVQDMPEGELVKVTAQHAAPVPDADAGHSYIYSVVFDSDEDYMNNWIIVPPYNGDYFQGADRWYQCIWDHASSTWEVVVTQVDNFMNTTTESSTARCVIEGDTITWHISKSELPASNLFYRVSAFGHDGAYSPDDRGGDVSGANATEPLTSL